MMTKRISAVVLLATLLMTALVTTAVPASAAGGEARLAAMRRAVKMSAVATKQATGGQANGTCATDPANDTRQLDNGAAVASPQADIVEHCVTFEDTLALALRVAQPTDPTSDAAWNRATFAGWFIDTTGDANGEFFAAYYRNAQNVLAADVRNVTNNTIVCSATPTYQNGTYTIAGITTGCLGNATAVRVQAGMFYDASTGNSETPVYTDVSPEAGNFGAPVSQAPDAPVCDDPAPAPFADRDSIAAVHRANVDCLYELGITTGTVVNGQRFFNPGANVTRGQFSGFTRRAMDEAGANLGAPKRPRFDDVPAGHTFDHDIHRLAGAEIIAGYANSNNFGPGDFVERGQTATILVGAYEFVTGNQLATTRTYFRDIRTSVHANNINAAYEANLMNGIEAPRGDEQGLFRPGANTTRQQMASVLVSFLEQL